MNTLPLVVVIATGGTIAMRTDPVTGALIPACSGEELAQAIPALKQVAQLEFIQASNVASPAMTPDSMWQLHQTIQQTLARPEVDGIVVTHGTDTLEETSYFLSLLHTSGKPVICTAAMRGADEVGADGPANIYSSVRAAASNDLQGFGVLICLNDLLQDPSMAIKTHSANPATFQSPWWGPVGYVDEDRVVIRHIDAQQAQRLQLAKMLTSKLTKLTARVDVIPAMTGSGREYLDFAASTGCQGIVIDGFGRGNVPPGMVAGIEAAVNQGIAVVISSRTHAGRVLDAYGYPGSVTDTCRVGAVMGGEVTAAKARLKLMMLLSAGIPANADSLQSYFDC